VNIIEGSVGDNKGAYNIPLEKGLVSAADRYYNDFPMLNIWDSSGVFIMIRHKKNIDYTIMKERELPKNTAQHVITDQDVELTNVQFQAKYSGRLRQVAKWLEENHRLSN